MKRAAASGHRRRPFLVALALSLLLLAGILLRPDTAQAQVQIDWDRYHDHEATTRIVHEWAEEYPELVELEQIGESVQGRELWLLTITNEATGPASEKSALWMDGNSDGGEILSREVALYLTDYLLRNYGEDPRATRILDDHTFYVEPNANPDAGEQVTRAPERGEFQGASRTGYLAPVDEDGDGVADEDPPEDINGDGLVVSMRVQDPNGEWKQHPEDSRLLVKRQPGDSQEDGPFYRFYQTEGIDNDGDGRINEDWLGGWDSNRQYPANWQPGFRQIGAPPYPLYTPEPKATVDAILDRPNVAALISLHTSGAFPGGTLWQPPASVFPDNFPVYDVGYLFPSYGQQYDEIMRRDPYTYSQATAANVREREPRGQIRATLIDWGYINQGIISWTPEIWAEGVFDYDGDGSISKLEMMRWNEEEWDGRVFVDWAEADHPDLGTVEVGGWRNDFDAHGLTPPEGILYRVQQINPWFLHVLESLPDLEITNSNVEDLGDDTYRVTATVTNVGFLDTSSTEHGAAMVEERGWEIEPSYVQVVKPVVASASVDAGEVLSQVEHEIGHLRGQNEGGGSRSEISRSWPNKATVSWIVRAPSGSSVTVRAAAPRAGVATLTVELE